jgi:hypothetical protein
MGSKGGSETSASKAQGELARRLFLETDPLRRGLINRFTQEFVPGGTTLSQQPTADIPGGKTGGIADFAARAQAAQGQPGTQPVAVNPVTSPLDYDRRLGTPREQGIALADIPRELLNEQELIALNEARGSRPNASWGGRAARKEREKIYGTRAQRLGTDPFTSIKPLPVEGLQRLGVQTGAPIQNQQGINLGASPVFTAGRNTLDQQFANAQQNIISSTPAGGALADRLANLEAQKATSIGNLGAGVSEADLNRAIGLATGQTAAAQSGFGSAAAAQAQQAQAQAQAKSGVGQAAGTAAGTYAAKSGPSKAATTTATAVGTGSDIRFKENLIQIGTLYNGLPVYVGNYIGEDRKQLFVIAQEVEKVLPDAVTELDGYKYVDYGMLTEGEMK